MRSPASGVWWHDPPIKFLKKWCHLVHPFIASIIFFFFFFLGGGGGGERGQIKKKNK